MMDQPKAWLKNLCLDELWYNTSVHSSNGMSPFEDVYGRRPPPLVRSIDSPLDTPYLATFIQPCEEIITKLMFNIEKSIANMKHKPDGRRLEVNFDIEEMV